MKMKGMKWLGACMALCWLGISQAVMAQAVIFPQEKQPGTAKLKEKKGVFTLSNELFTAKFINQDGKLMFAGSMELGLMPDTEIFKIRLGDGTEVTASDMELEEVGSSTLRKPNIPILTGALFSKGCRV